MSASTDYITKKDLKNTVDKAVEDITEVIRDGFSIMASKKDLQALEKKIEIMEKQMATKDDLNELRDKVKEYIAYLERKLIDDTGAMTGAEQKHFRSITQRVARLEKHVFKTP